MLEDPASALTGRFASVDWREAGRLGGLLAAVVLLWDTPFVSPLKILVVFFHELSHGLAAVATGGSVLRIEIVAGQGGVCVTAGGSRFLILTAGYLGSLVCGGLLLLLAARTRADRLVMCLLGACLLGVSLLYVRPLLSFGFFFGATTAGVLLWVGARLRPELGDFLLRLIGLTSCLYAPLDIKSDILDRPHLQSDAAMLADLTGVPAVFWGLLWGVAALVVSFHFLAVSCRRAPSTSRGVAEPLDSYTIRRS